jgi:hypothetical protein
MPPACSPPEPVRRRWSAMVHEVDGDVSRDGSLAPIATSQPGRPRRRGAVPRLIRSVPLLTGHHWHQRYPGHLHPRRLSSGTAPLLTGPPLPPRTGLLAQILFNEFATTRVGLRHVLRGAPRSAELAHRRGASRMASSASRHASDRTSDWAVRRPDPLIAASTTRHLRLYDSLHRLFGNSSPSSMMKASTRARQFST